MPRGSLKKAKVYFVSILSILLCTTALFRFASAATDSKTKADKDQANSTTSKFIEARPSKNGRLHVEGTHIVDEKGKAVQLRGVSTHGLTWYPDFVNQSLFDQVSTDWNANLMRLAMYSTVYCSSEEEQAKSLELMKKGIDAAIKADMYVLVDWHILEDNNPNINVGKALEFFEQISSEYAKYPNIIFEICNEPNGMTNWADVASSREAS